MSGSLSIVGGLYRERCLHPHWDAVLGSAGRAAQTLSALPATSCRLHGYVGENLAADVRFVADLAGFELSGTNVPNSVTFDYSHPLADPSISPAVALLPTYPQITVKDEVVLRYGILEGDAVVEASTAVYDPQSAFRASSFSANGSTASRLAVVLNRREMKSITGMSEPGDGAAWLFEHDAAEVVVLKMGALGATVFTRSGRVQVPLYRSDRVWKIGSGDVFSATFARFWALGGLPPDQAADLASRSTAWYCNSRSLPPPDADTLKREMTEPLKPGSGKVYLAAPFFDLGQRWIVEEARRALLQGGARVFSPVHEVGHGAAEDVAVADLQGLESCDVLFAILNGMDVGTVFEAGYAKKLGIPIVALAENAKEEDLKMFGGSGAQICADFTTAIYQTIWSLPS